MRLVFSFLLSALLVVCSCGKRDVPRGILPQKKMQSVLWDMIQADEFVRDYMLTRDTTLNDTLESTKLYTKVFELNKVTKDEFTRSFDYYKTHPSLMKEVMDSLNAMAQRTPEVSTPRQLDKIDTSALRKTRPALDKQ